MEEYPEYIYIVHLPSDNVTGIVKEMGLYASKVFYSIDEVDYEEMVNNADFVVTNEILLSHYLETDNDRK